MNSTVQVVKKIRLLELIEQLENGDAEIRTENEGFGDYTEVLDQDGRVFDRFNTDDDLTGILAVYYRKTYAGKLKTAMFDEIESLN